MKTIEELKQMSADIGRAIMTYHFAIAENLKEVGIPVDVQGDDDVQGINISIEQDGSLHDCVITKIKWDEERKEVMVFCETWDYCDNKEWIYLSELGDATDYVLDAIQWPGQ